jgi:hypothetical protein
VFSDVTDRHTDMDGPIKYASLNLERTEQGTRVEKVTVAVTL